MTSFVASTEAGGTGTTATSFQAPGAAPATDAIDDNTVVFEHGGRKFTKADLAKKLDSADQFIEQLKTEGARNREALDAAAKALKDQVNAVDLLKQIKQGQGAPEGSTQAPATAPAAAPSVDDVVAALEKRNDAKAVEAQRDTNWANVTTALTKAFGAAVDQRVAQVASQHGMSLEQAAQMAKATPSAFLALFPDLTKKATASPIAGKGSVNTLAFKQPENQGSSGYMKATSVKELVNIYQQRLAEVASRG